MPVGEVRPYPRNVTTRDSRAQLETSLVVASREMVTPGSSAPKIKNAMSSGCEYSPSFCQPSTVMIALCVTVCDDCWVFTPGAYTEIGLVVTVPVEVTTQWAAVTTIRLVHSAPLHVLLPLRILTTAVLPSAEVPPTTACAGDTVNGEATSPEVSAQAAASSVVSRRNALRCTRLRL